MKIGFVLSSLSRLNGGISESVRRLAQSLPLPGGQVRAFGLRDAHTDDDAALWHPVPIHPCAVRGPRAFGRAPELAPALDAFDPDLTHAAGLWMYPSVVNHHRHRRTKKPYLVSPHGMLDAWALRNSAWKKRLASLAYERAHLRDAPCLHALCAAEADAIRAYGLKQPVCVIPNGVDVPDLSTPVPPPPWSDRVPAGTPVLFFLGRLHPKKGLIPLVEAWARARPQDWRLVIAGWDQGGHGREVEQLARMRGVAQSVVLLGPVHGAQKASAYRAASGFVLSSFSEGLPMTILEAWSYACPVLMTPACNLPEGFAARAAVEISTDPEALAEQFRAFCALSDEARKAIGMNGRALVERAFTWPGVAARMMQVYEWLVGRAEPPACVTAD